MNARTVSAAAIALVLLTAGCLGAPTTAPAAADDGTTRTIGVSATGSTSADPDLAVVRVSVVAVANTADAARGQVADDAARTRAAIRDLGIPDESVRTTFFSVVPEYDFSRDGRELVGYRATHAFEIETGVDEAGAAIDAAVGNGASRVDGVEFTLREETRRDLRDDALEEAMANARSDADTIAGAAGVTITGVHSASTGSVGFVPVTARLEADAGGGATTLEPGPVTVTASVQVTYTIG